MDLNITVHGSEQLLFKIVYTQDNSTESTDMLLPSLSVDFLCSQMELHIHPFATRKCLCLSTQIAEFPINQKISRYCTF